MLGLKWCKMSKLMRQSRKSFIITHNWWWNRGKSLENLLPIKGESPSQECQNVVGPTTTLLLRMDVRWTWDGTCLAFYNHLPLVTFCLEKMCIFVVCKGWHKITWWRGETRFMNMYVHEHYLVVNVIATTKFKHKSWTIIPNQKQVSIL